MKVTLNYSENGFTGTVTLNYPTQEEKASLLEEVSSISVARKEGEAINTKEALILAKKMSGVVIPRIMAIDLVHTETNTEIKEVDHLGLYKEGNEIIGTLGSWLLGGIPMGKLKSTN